MRYNKENTIGIYNKIFMYTRYNLKNKTIFT